MTCRAFSFALLCLLSGRPGCAAVPTTFALLSGNSSIVWSKAALNKGDVVEVHAFKAEPGTLVLLGICNDNCDNLHVVKSISAYRPPANNVTEKYTLEESGHLACWTARPSQPDLHANPAADSRTGGGGASNEEKIQSGVSGSFTDANIMQIRKFEVDIDQIKVRFDGGRYVTLSRISAASP
jgi:hypothetical protein